MQVVMIVPPESIWFLGFTDKWGYMEAGMRRRETIWRLLPIQSKREGIPKTIMDTPKLRFFSLASCLSCEKLDLCQSVEIIFC